ncbi:aminotransferase class V-fold PLP-dependent enzyme [Hyphococcus luteus]|uniref:Aminotransferase n=1 Tax=Hyphococcus luteus TaxID=2058213 RepID=A0A2S7K930_9PROT|nr:aminotransferase class V-fold PLP-dependent enzyme [Marinicaulis flavus]PQA89014.1 aminotransferase [Marinicaulis flavus]
MPALRSDVDPDGLLEYSVVYTDRSLNHMSAAFQKVMRTLSAELKGVYNADAAALVPGGGTYAMEAVARQIATDKKVLVVRNGWFSFRWTQILDAGKIADETIVMKARRMANAPDAPFAPAPIDDVVARIAAEKPDVVFAPHVETSSGMILPDDYLKKLGEAAHEAGAVFVLDCIASGCVWADMKDAGVDFLISAPQKGWSASPCAGIVMMSDRGRERVKASTSTSFACDLGKWLEIMEAYEKGGHAYHATMPTDALRGFLNAVLETKENGYEAMREAQWELGRKTRALLTSRGFPSVAAEGFEAPGVVVSYTSDPEIKNGLKFAAQGLQIAAGVPLQCDEPESFSTFRIGLFGLDKLTDVDGAVARLEAALDKIV